MRNFIKNIAQFLLVFIVINLIFNQGYLLFLRNNSIDYRSYNQLLSKDASELKSIFFGSSHTQESVNASLLKSAFNMGGAAESYLQTYYKVKYIIDKYNIENVFIEFELHSFLPQMGSKLVDKDLFYMEFIQYSDLNEPNLKLSFIKGYLEGNIFGYKGNFQPFSDQILEKKNSQILDGYLNRGGGNYSKINPERRVQVANRKASAHFNNGYFEERVFQYFEKVIDLCIANNIQVGIIKYPVSEPYFNAARKYVDIPYIENRLHKLMLQYQNKKMNRVFVLDYREIFFNQIESFRDPDHLNKNGADKFTKMLMDDLKLMGYSI